MGLTNVLFGRKKLKKADERRLFAISTARITLETELGLKPSGSAADIFKPLSAAEFVRAENEMQELPIEQDLTRWLALFDAPI